MEQHVVELAVVRIKSLGHSLDGDTLTIGPSLGVGEDVTIKIDNEFEIDWAYLRELAQNGEYVNLAIVKYGDE